MTDVWDRNCWGAAAGAKGCLQSCSCSMKYGAASHTQNFLAGYPADPKCFRSVLEHSRQLPALVLAEKALLRVLGTKSPESIAPHKALYELGLHG